MPLPYPTEDEIIAILERTDLPTILVEGGDDALVYRDLESRLGVFNANVLPCSGRSVVLSIYSRRQSFKHGKLAWLADVDMWLFSGRPPGLDGVIFTTGYSIENDLYAGSEIENLLDEGERLEHSAILAVACKWFTFEMLEHSNGREPQLHHHLREVVDEIAGKVSETFQQRRQYCPPNDADVQRLIPDYRLWLRGKTLFQALVMILSAPRRRAKFGYNAVLEMCTKLYPDNPYMVRLQQEVSKALS